ncbi:MAG TPA: NUDIX hydrolase [Polyangium sp.]|nr:NUDIX hydrolase [Polyangium sp.]
MGPLSLLPASVLGLAREVGRHLLRRPVVGVAIAARVEDGRWLLIRRGDTGTWALPGGTLEWGETLRASALRELQEEAGVFDAELGPVVGVFSRPDRDIRFHAVTVVITAKVGLPRQAPMNPLEIREVKLFQEDELPRPLALGMDDMLDAARRGTEVVFE